MDKMANMQGMFGMNFSMGIAAEAMQKLQQNMLNAAAEAEGSGEGLDSLNISLFGGGQDIEGSYAFGEYYDDADYDEAMARAEAAEADMEDIQAESELEGNEVMSLFNWAVT